MNFNTQNKKILTTNRVLLIKEKREAFARKLKEYEISYTYDKDCRICFEVTNDNMSFVNALMKEFIGDFK